MRRVYPTHLKCAVNNTKIFVYLIHVWYQPLISVPAVDRIAVSGMTPQKYRWRVSRRMFLLKEKELPWRRRSRLLWLDSSLLLRGRLFSGHPFSETPSTIITPMSITSLPVSPSNLPPLDDDPDVLGV